MKQTIALSAFALAASFSGTFAQDRHFYEVPEKIERENFNITFQKVVSKKEYLKFGMIVENNSNDFIVFENSDGKVVANENEFDAAKKKTFVYPPNTAKSKTFDVKGENLLVKNFQFDIGKLFKVSAEGKKTEIPEFKLPAEKNVIKVGNFKIELLKVRKKTDLTLAKFHCTYLGDDLAIIKPNNISVRVKEDKIFANETRTKDSYLLKKGDKFAFTLSFKIEAKVVDMQFADMFIQWNDAFQESKKEPLKGETIEFKIDQALTDGEK